MTDTKTLAYINMYAVLGTLENLCELDDKAKEAREASANQTRDARQAEPVSR